MIHPPSLHRLLCLFVAGLMLATCPAPALDTPPLTADALQPEKPEWAKHHPCIVLDAPGLARVKKRIATEPETAAYWDKLKTECDKYVTPGSPDYLDESKAFDTYLAMHGGTHKAQGALEGAVRKWLSPIEILSFAYAVSGDERYGKKAVALALAAATKIPPPAMKEGFFYTNTFAERSEVLALDWCYPLFTTDERQTMRQAILDRTNELYFQSLNSIWGQTSLGRVWNWNGGISSAWGLGALVLDGETRAPTRQWLFQATRNVEDYLRFGVDPQGAVVEGPSYFGYGAGYIPYFVEGLKLRTGEDLYTETHFNKFTAWFPLETLPGGKRVNNLEDSDYVLSNLESPTYALYRDSDRALARWIWEQHFRDNPGVTMLSAAILWAPEVVDPATVKARVAQMPVYGWSGGRSSVVSRSGYGADDVYFSLHAQQYTAIRHDQADKGQFTLYADGDDLVVDSGYGNDSLPDKSTSGFAHNEVMVDGKPELMGGAHAQTDGWILNSFHSPLADLTSLDVADAYRYFYKGSMSYERTYAQDFQRADRQAVFVRQPYPYVVLFDDVKKDNDAHDYTWMLHTRAGKDFKQVGKTIQILPAQVDPQTVVGEPIPADGAEHDGKWTGTVQVPAAGKYTVWGLTGTTNVDGEKSNSFFLQIKGGKQGFAGGDIPDRFVWATYAKVPLSWMPLNDNNAVLPVPALDFEAGPVDLTLLPRETGAMCAALALVPASVQTPLRAGFPLPEGTLVIQTTDGEVSGSMVRQVVTPPPQKAWLQVGLIAPTDWTQKVEPFETTTEGSHPRLSVTAHGDDGQFLTMLLPHLLQDNKPTGAVDIPAVPAQLGHAGQVAVSADTTDLAACWDGTSGIAVQDIATDAEFIWLRRTNGKVVALAATNVSRLSIAGQAVITSRSGKTNVLLAGGKAFVPNDADVDVNPPGGHATVEKVTRPVSWYGDPSFR